MSAMPWSPVGRIPWSVCYETMLRSSQRRKTGINDSACLCPPRQQLVMHDKVSGAPGACQLGARSVWPEGEGVPRLIVAIAAHISDAKAWLLLRRSVCSVLHYHPEATLVVVDNASPLEFATQLRHLAASSRRVHACRSSRSSGWGFGALAQASEWVDQQEATHFAYLQHSMALRRPLPLATLPVNCTFVNYQHFRGRNMDSEERAKHWIMRAWVEREWNALGGVWPKNDAFHGVYSHGFVSTRRAMSTITSLGLFHARVCSKTQDEGTERLLGLAAEAVADSPQGRCSLDGPLFHPSQSEMRDVETLHVEKISHLRPSNSVFKAGASTTSYRKLNMTQLATEIGRRCPGLFGDSSAVWK